MKLNLNTDIVFLNKKQEIENKIDNLIDSAKYNLSTKLKEELNDEKTFDGVIELINTDLEEKRINLKKHFNSELEQITIKAFDEAMKKFDL